MPLGVRVIGDSVMSGEELVGFAEELARVAGAGGGAAALGAQVAAFFGGVVLVEDAEWRNLAVAGEAAQAVPPSARELVAAAGAGAEPGIIALPATGDGARGYAARIGGESGGWISVFPTSVPPPERLGALRLAAAAIGVELARDVSGPRNRRRAFWERLLARAYDDLLEARDDAAARGIALAPGYLAVALELEGLDESSAAVTGDLRRVALETLRGAAGAGELAVIERGSGIVILCPAPVDADAANVRTAATFVPRAASKAGIEATIVGGIGRRAETLAAHRTVDEAREALFVTRRLLGGSRVMPYEDLGIYPLLVRGGATPTELQAFSARVLAPLQAYDRRHQSELVHTLRRYFDLGQNVKTAAAELSVHRHTVFYRLRQVAEIGGYDLDSPHDQLTLRAALALAALAPGDR